MAEQESTVPAVLSGAGEEEEKPAGLFEKPPANKEEAGGLSFAPAASGRPAMAASGRSLEVAAGDGVAPPAENIGTPTSQCARPQ